MKARKIIATVIVISLFFILGSCETQQTTVLVPLTVNLPRRMQLIAQSCDSNSMYQTAIDLDTKEIVILVYNEVNLISVIHTGIHGEPGTQPALPSRDAPAPADTRGRQNQEDSEF